MRETIAYYKGKATSFLMTSNGDIDFEVLVTDSIATNITLLQNCSLKGLIFVNLFVWMSFCLLPLIGQRVRFAVSLLENFLEKMRR